MRSVMFYEPDEHQDVILGIGESVPRKAVDPKSGKIVEGSQVTHLKARNRQRAEWARREGSRTDIRIDTIEEEDERMIEALRAQEEPLPTIRDRWGNEIPVVGYGTGTYYRLSRQPAWVIRQMISGADVSNDPNGTDTDGRSQNM